MTIQILGTGWPKCQKLHDLVVATALSLDLSVEVEKITDIMEIMKFNVLQLPGLVINGVLKVAGRIPSIKELKQLLTESTDG